jgi:hypothetical protein
LSDATARRCEDVLGSVGRRTWASALTAVVDNCGDKDKKRAGNEYPRHNVRAGPTADRKDLASDDQCTSNHDHDDSGPAGMSCGSGHDRNCTRAGLQCRESRVQRAPTRAGLDLVGKTGHIQVPEGRIPLLQRGHKVATGPRHDSGQCGYRTAPGLYRGGLCSIGGYRPLRSPPPPPVVIAVF